jgi:hypothetical protein
MTYPIWVNTGGRWNNIDETSQNRIGRWCDYGLKGDTEVELHNKARVKLLAY